MREIKFRGKRLDTGEWIYGSLVKEFDGWSICDWSSPAYSRYDVDPETVGQYTGRGENGVDIYEGDIVRFAVENQEMWSGATHGYIEYDDGDLGFVIVDAKKNIITVNRGYDAYGGSLEVIGNIHDTPELLQNGEKQL